jgi:hypothetical protein
MSVRTANKLLHVTALVAVLLAMDALVPRGEGMPPPLVTQALVTSTWQQHTAWLHLDARAADVQLAQTDVAPASAAPIPDSAPHVLLGTEPVTSSTAPVAAPTSAVTSSNAAVPPVAALVTSSPPPVVPHTVAVTSSNATPDNPSGAAVVGAPHAVAAGEIAAVVPPVVPAADVVDAMTLPDDPRWGALGTKLAALAAGHGETVRVVHLGDSEIAGDFVAGTLRRRFRETYGDGGPGFALALAPWTWYVRERFSVGQPDGFSTRSFVFGRQSDGNYGPGGVAFDAQKTHAAAELRIDNAGHDACHLSLFYGTQPGGSDVDLVVDGNVIQTASTDAPERGVGHITTDLKPCPARITAKADGPNARLFGWSVEWLTPGVVWSSLGVVSASAQHFEHYAPGRAGEALAALSPDLVVVAYGLNVANVASAPPQKEGDMLERLLDEVHTATPGAACLVMSPYPIAIAVDDDVVPSPSVARLAAQQKKVALDKGCAFLDRQLLAGGPRMALRWLNAKPRILSGDYVHLTRAGSEAVGIDVARILLAHLHAGS